MGPCHCIIIYNTLSRKAGLAHIDDLIIIKSLDIMFFKVITDTDSKHIKIYVAGGHGNYDLTVKIFDYIATKKLKGCVVGTALHNNNKGKIGIDTRTGIIGIYYCSQRKDVIVPIFPISRALRLSNISL